MTEPRSYFEERNTRRRRRALGALAVAGLMAAAALWVLGAAEPRATEPAALAMATLPAH